MGRRIQHLVDAALLDDAPRVHDRHAVGESGHHREIVGDPDQRHLPLAAQALHLVEDLGLDGHVEGGGRLVRDDQVRLVQHGDGDDHPLAHASGELVGIGAQPLFRGGDADEAEGVARTPPRRVAADLRVRPDRLDHLRVDAQQRVQRHHGVLEDHGDARSAQPPELGLAGGQKVPAVEDDPARGNAARLVDQADDGEAGDRLAGPRFTDQAEDLAAPQAEVDAVHRGDDPGPGGELGAQPLDAQQLVSRTAQPHPAHPHSVHPHPDHPHPDYPPITVAASD